MINILSPLFVLLIDLVLWFLAFDVAENFDFPLLNVILFGAAFGLLIGFLYDSLDLFKTGINSSSSN